MEAIPFGAALVVMNALGLPGLMFIIWHFDNKRFQRDKEVREREIQERERAIQMVLMQYREDVSQVRSLYENNVLLCKNYDQAFSRLEKITGEMMGIVSLNSQSFTQLSDAIRYYYLEGRDERADATRRTSERKAG